MRRAGVLGLVFAVVLGIVTIVVALTTSVIDNMFNGHVGLDRLPRRSRCSRSASSSWPAARSRASGEFGAYGVSMGAEGIIRLAAVHPARRRRGRPTRSGSACASRSRRCSRRCVAMRGQRGLDDAGPARAVVGALDQPRLPARRIDARAGAQLRAVHRRAGAGQAGRARPRSPTSSSACSSRASRSCCSRRCRPRCCRKLSALVERGPRRRVPRGVRKLVIVVVGIGVARRRRRRRRSGRWPGNMLFGDEVQPRQRRRRVARGRQRAVHPRAHAVAGADRARRRTRRR